MKIRRGFTMLELGVVLIMLGILAIIAVPLCIDLRGNANQAANDAMANAMGLASAANKAACKESKQIVIQKKSVKVSKCSDIAPLVRPVVTLKAPGRAVKNGYNLMFDARVTKNGMEAACMLQRKINGKTYTSSFIVTGACN